MKSRRCLVFCVATLSLVSLVSSGCTDINSYKTFVMNEGVLHFALEYRAYYKIDYIKPAEATGTLTQQGLSFVLKGPLIRKINDYTSIHVGAEKPEKLVPDAKSGSERAERNAASWADYKLLNKSETTIDGVRAYRLDYQNRNIVPAIAGVSNKLFIEVIREVTFDAKGYVWMIWIQSDSSTAEADKADFEHVLKTFKILN